MIGWMNKKQLNMSVVALSAKLFYYFVWRRPPTESKAFPSFIWLRICTKYLVEACMKDKTSKAVNFYADLLQSSAKAQARVSGGLLSFAELGIGPN